MPFASVRRKCFVRGLRANENRITASRPPGASAADCLRQHLPQFVESSRLMKIRMAWKLRVAGSLLQSEGVGTARAITSASRRVVAIGDPARVRTIARAHAARVTLLAVLVQHGRFLLRGAEWSHGAALMPPVGSMRMSSGPSRRKLKPRRARRVAAKTHRGRAGCPCTRPWRPRTSSRGLQLRERSVLKVEARIGGKALAHRRHRVRSRSNASTRPCDPNRSRIARVCPPRPQVAST